MPRSTTELVQQCLSGDSEAWRALIDEFAGLVYGVARQHGLSDHQADDVAQTVFAQLVRSLGSIQDPAALPGWLSTSARRESWRVLRARARDTRMDQTPEPAALSTSEISLESLEQAQTVRSALLRLEPRCRDLLWALFLGPQPPDYTRISGELSIPVGSIGPTRKRCLAKLADLMPPDPAREEADASEVSGRPTPPPYLR